MSGLTDTVIESPTFSCANGSLSCGISRFDCVDAAAIGIDDIEAGWAIKLNDAPND